MDQGQEVRHLVLLRPRVHRIHLRLAEGTRAEEVKRSIMQGPGDPEQRAACKGYLFPDHARRMDPLPAYRTESSRCR